MRVPRVLGVAIANDFSAEVGVFAELVRHSEGDVAPFVLIQHRRTRQGAEVGALERFCERSPVRAVGIDFGWRPSARRKTKARHLAQACRLGPAILRSIWHGWRFKPDVIYSSQQTWDCLVATTLSIALLKPQVIHLHYNIGPWLGRIALWRLQRCSHVLAVSQFIADQAIAAGIPPHRVTTIHNTMHVRDEKGLRAGVRRELGLSDDAFVVGMVARLDPLKGQADAIRAFESVAKLCEAQLVIVGDGPIRSDLEDLVSSLDLDGRVIFTGHRSDVPRLLTAFDVFAHPSRMEPFGLAVLEALASGVPVVAYDEGGTRELISTGTTGILAEPGDTQQLAGALITLTDSNRRLAMGAAARASIEERFRPEVAGADFALVIQQVVAGRRVEPAHRQLESSSKSDAPERPIRS